MINDGKVIKTWAVWHRIPCEQIIQKDFELDIPWNLTQNNAYGSDTKLAGVTNAKKHIVKSYNKFCKKVDL